MADENLPPFSEAYSKGLLINEDDDFFADELEDLLDLSLAFAGALLHFRLLRLIPLRFQLNEKVVLVACSCMCARASVRPVSMLRCTDELVERADVDGDPELYNKLRSIILTHAHETNDVVHASHQQPKRNARTKSPGRGSATDSSLMWRP